MKRDWEIIRAILVQLEKAPTANANVMPEMISGYTEQAVAYNMRLLHQAGHLSGVFESYIDDPEGISVAIALFMTASGHELLDTIRNDTVWTKVQEAFRSKGLDMTFALVTEIGKSVIKSMLALP